MATVILGVVGAVAGSYVPGVGWQMGWAIGTTIGGIIESQQALGNADAGKLTDLRLSGSAYGAVYPMGWGKFRVGGNTVWVYQDADGNHLVEHKSTSTSGGKGGKGGGSSTNYTYSATWATVFCIGSMLTADGTFVNRNPVVKKIWFDDKLVYDSTSGTNQVIPTFYPGTETQDVDYRIQANEQAKQGSDASAYRGLVYAVFDGISLSDFANRIPNISAEIWTDAVTVGDIASDIVRQTGILNSEIDFSAADSAVTGYILTQRSNAQDNLDPLLKAYGYDLIEVDGMLELIPRGGDALLTIPESDMGARLDSDSDDFILATEVFQSEINLPYTVELTYYDSGKDYNQVTQGDSLQTVTTDNQIQLTLPLTLSGDDARAICATLLDTAWVEARTIKFSVPIKYIKLCPADVVNIYIDSTLYRCRITEIENGIFGQLNITALPDDPNTLSQNYGGGSGGGGGGGSSETVPTDFKAWSGKELHDIDQLTCGFYIGGDGGTGWQGAAVYYSPDSGTTWIPCATLSSRATIGDTESVLGDGVTAYDWDDTHTVDVSILDTGTLSSASDVEVENGVNWIVIGEEILGFGVATLNSPGHYTLSHLYRGLRGSEMTGHSSPEKVALSDSAIVRVALADSYVGQSIDVKAVSPGIDIDDVTAQTITIAPKTASVAGAGRTIAFVFDGGGNAIQTNQKTIPIYLPFDCTISSVVVLGDTTGSIQIDIWCDSYANYPPTDLDSICASAQPKLVAESKSTDSTLTGWNVELANGDCLIANVDSNDVIKQCSVFLIVQARG